MCVCVLRVSVRERGDSVDAAFAGPVLVAGAVRHSVPPRDLGHVTDCAEGPLPQSWPSTDTRALHGEFGFFVVGEFSAATDADGVIHCARVDATTLSAECQQPCQPIRSRVTGTPQSVVQQRFSQRRPTLEEISSTPRSGTVSALAKDPPTCANCVPRV